MEGRGRRRLGGAGTARFAALYRAACADLALADAYNLPAGTVAYLHRLVARAHNQLYRSRRFDLGRWGHELFHEVPRRLRSDNCLRAALLMFWGLFFAAFLFGRQSPEFLNTLVGKEQLDGIRDMYAHSLARENSSMSSLMNGFYIYHNIGIALECFAWGLLFGVGGLVDLAFNAIQLGAIFGFMNTVPEWHNFSQFVTAHGPFELTAIAVSAAAGMRLGFSMINTHGLSRIAVAPRSRPPSDADDGGRNGDAGDRGNDRGVFVPLDGAVCGESVGGRDIEHLAVLLHLHPRPPAGSGSVDGGGLASGGAGVDQCNLTTPAS